VIHGESASRSVRSFAGIHSARLGREWRVLYEIDDTKHVVVVLDIRHRSNAYRLR
jgi:mRNA interferase RelE/StbE